MFDSHVEQIAQLHPQTIRIFVQEFFDLNPKPGKYHWAFCPLEAFGAIHPKSESCLPEAGRKAEMDRLGELPSMPCLREATSKRASIWPAKIPWPLMREPNWESLSLPSRRARIRFKTLS